MAPALVAGALLISGVAQAQAQAQAVPAQSAQEAGEPLVAGHRFSVSSTKDPKPIR